MEAELNDTALMLNNKKIFFGHQSVGQNIVDGLHDLLAERKVPRVNVVEISPGGQELTTGGIYHGRVGRNRDPDSKIKDFAARVGELSPMGLDVAMFKFCYVDIDEKADVTRLFDAYRSTMRELQRQFPRVHLVHITVPLTHIRDDWKAMVKRLLGKVDAEIERNIRREAFNDLLRAEYERTGDVFDLAKVESTNEDGSQTMFTRNGNKYPMLSANFTDDYEHLNNVGRKLVAIQMLRFLDKVASSGGKDMR